jgi:hypothetical protein
LWNAPEPEKGKYTVEQKNPKIQILIDWSVSAGLLVHKEYKHFCNWASI